MSCAWEVARGYHPHLYVVLFTPYNASLTKGSVKYVPEWFPGAGFKRQARIWKKHADALADNPLIEAKVGFHILVRLRNLFDTCPEP